VGNCIGVTGVVIVTQYIKHIWMGVKRRFWCPIKMMMLCTVHKVNELEFFISQNRF
jgi:hypothetical protein